jgi:hypothetical protein
MYFNCFPVTGHQQALYIKRILLLLLSLLLLLVVVVVVLYCE